MLGCVGEAPLLDPSPIRSRRLAGYYTASLAGEVGAAAKPPLIVCFKASSSPGTSPPPLSDEGRGGGARTRRSRWRPGLAAEADCGEVEQRALTAALASKRDATVLGFYWPRCRLCASLQGLVCELEDGANGRVSFVLVDAEDDRWLPEFTGGAGVDLLQLKTLLASPPIMEPNFSSVDATVQNWRDGVGTAKDSEL
ncbi:hypothetical protein E2562_014136 [Oryza meyeriana var. granulata]|uniref:Thioredoxin domain-containing protein n=1 Tax=Oryza meyeriana var. granulata TaxID=110450 RepID=A0A6G1F896_9ORYZ|nr:hypothetical protein E2562_014136 [Oryza meyeriana var. granulata]